MIFWSTSSSETSVCEKELHASSRQITVILSPGIIVESGNMTKAKRDESEAHVDAILSGLRQSCYSFCAEQEWLEQMVVHWSCLKHQRLRPYVAAVSDLLLS